MHKAVARVAMFGAVALLAAACGDEDGESGSTAAAPPTSETPADSPAPESGGNAAPTIDGTPAVSTTAGVEYSFTPAAADDDADALSFAIVNRPSWATFNAANGRLSGMPNSDDVGVYPNIRISVSDGSDSAALAQFGITVTAAGGGSSSNTAPTISGAPASSVEQDSPYSFTPTAEDQDGDTLSYTIENLPAWASFDPVTGRLQGTPGPDDVGPHAEILIAASDGNLSASLEPFEITVTATGDPNSAPAIWGAPAPAVAEGSLYWFRPATDDADGDSLVFSIENQPSWTTFSRSTGRLRGTPERTNVGRHDNIRIRVSDGDETAELPPFAITVDPAPAPAPNSAPEISGTPPASVQQGTQWSFTPRASDADGDALTFSISNRPGWATFSTSTGRLQGTPANTGTWGSIRITVSDGEASATLGPFSINVTAAPVSNSPPTISGSPSSSVLEGSFYGFTPRANDSDGDTLTFSISNRPAWASFNSSTGRLHGTPNASDAGTYGNIRISVSDGSASASLPAFSVTVTASATGSATLSWLPPTENADGSPLTNLAGYTVHWGTSSGNYTNSVTINNVGITTYVVDNLVSGTYYFATRAFNQEGMYSSYSNEASKTIP